MTVLFLIQRLVNDRWETIGAVFTVYSKSIALELAHKNPIMHKLLAGHSEDAQFLKWIE